MTRAGRRRLWVTVAIVAALPLLLPLIALPGAKARVLEGLRAGLGRPIEAQELHLHLYPVPGVELDQVRLGEDPAFGIEDMVVADSATASIRLLSLFSGRLAFSRIHLEGASINLVRNAQGEWNVTALLDRAARGGSATAKRALPPAQRFPYLDWSDSRVNFKLVQTKQRFFLDQVQGSLARDKSGWRLQTHFQPERTDLSLSNTGDVTLDGRWPAAAAGFHQRPFELELRLRNSYLAGSTALLVGHDAGVHGVLNAQMHVAGTGRQFSMSGTVQIASLRRWDLLPPSSNVRAAFAGSYAPGADRLQITGIGDSGFQRVQLSGAVTNLFGHPVADLQLQVRQAPADWLLPLLMAVKAQVPSNLHFNGTLAGTAGLHWDQGLSGQGRLRLQEVGLSNGQTTLTLPPAVMQWNGASLQLAPSAADLEVGGRTGIALTAGGQVTASGFELVASSPHLAQSSVRDLAQLVGVETPWPAGITGTAIAHLQLQGSWEAAGKAAWTGTLLWPTAIFRHGPDQVALRGLSITFADPKPRVAQFTAVLGPAGSVQAVSGSVQWNGAATQPIQVSLQAPQGRDRSGEGRLRLGPLLASTPLRGLLRGGLEGSVKLQWPAAKMVEAAGAGSFSLTQGVLRTSEGPRSFESFEGAFHMDHGKLNLEHLVWKQGGRIFRGQGSADVSSPGGRFQLELHDGTEQLRLSGRVQS